MDTLEQVAQQIHEGWREFQTSCGRVLGAARTETTHPHLIPWEELDRDSQNQDRFMAAVLLDAWSSGRLAIDQLPRAIHEAWRRWIQIQGRTHHHALPFEQAHAESLDDHAAQALRVKPLLEATRRAGT